MRTGSSRSVWEKVIPFRGSRRTMDEIGVWRWPIWERLRRVGPNKDETRRVSRRALVIGIDEYQHVSRLNGPVNDAEDIAAFIIRHSGFKDGDVRTLRDSEATRKNILKAFDEWLVQGTKTGDEVFVYFSGHGFQQPDTNGDEQDRLDETLVPVDAFVTDDGRVEGMITDDEIRGMVDRLPGRSVQVVVDACHSGTSTRAGTWG